MRLPTIHPFLMSLLGDRARNSLTPPSSEDPAWNRIVEEADRHGLLPVLSSKLDTLGFSHSLSPSLLDRIKRSVVEVAARNLKLATELTAILRAFETRGLACLPLRGLALAERLYGDITARPMGDIDLLVRREAVPEVAHTLGELGFREIDRRPGFARTFSYSLECLKEDHGSVIVEPHWTIAYPPFADLIDMNAVWNRCVRGEVLGKETKCLCPTDLLVHLCFHVLHRRDSAPLLWFYELDRLLRQDAAELDWSQITLVAQHTGQEQLLAMVFERLKDSFNSPIPDPVCRQLMIQPVTQPARPAAGAISKRVVRLLVGESQVDGRESFALVFTLKGFPVKVRYAYALLFPSSEFMLLHYGLSSRRQLCLWYLIRLGRLSWESLKGIAGLLFPSRMTRRSLLH